MDGSEGQFVSQRPRWRKKRWFVPALVLAALVVTAILAWSNRIAIADDFIADQLESNDLPATYTIDRIGGRNQIISDLVIGDPGSPDFTATRVIVQLRHRLGLPVIDKITLVEPRLYGRFVDGTLSFGALDTLLFGESQKDPGLPDIDLAIRDGRGLIESQFGPVGIKLAGSGNVADGFAGTLAAAAPDLSVSDCRGDGVTLYGKLTTASGKPTFRGPLRMTSLACKKAEVLAANLVAEVKLTTNDTLADPAVEARIASDLTQSGQYSAQSIAGTVRAQMRGEDITARYSLASRGVETPQAIAALLTAEGRVLARQNFEMLDIEGDVEGNGLRLGRELDGAFSQLATFGGGTLLEPIVRRVSAALQAQTRGSAIELGLRLRSDKRGVVLSVPQGELRGGGGTRLVSLSRLEYSAAQGRPTRLSGNISTGGPALPRIRGRMERSGRGDALFSLSMAQYEAGGSSLAIPRLSLTRGESGALVFSGNVEATGKLPGGAVDRLALPIDGRWTPDSYFTLWRDCTKVSFRRLRFAQLNIAGPGMTLCPPPGTPMLQYGAGGIQFAAGAPSLDLAGSLGTTPIRLSSGPVGFAYPGVLKARNVDVSLGPVATASRFAVSDIDARIGENIAGTFAGAEIALSSVPMNLKETAGSWDYTDGRVSIADASFRLVDRQSPARFEPLVARGASLTLVDNIIDAVAELRNPQSDRIVTTADIRHNLGTGDGQADLRVAGLQFDDQLQPEDISKLARGVVANALGVIDGTGRIRWTSGGEVKSTGSFSSDDLDFAAAFGPVKGASGTVVFTDLLGLTTAPGQTIRVASVNPGIEVTDGEVQFRLERGELLAVQGGQWPFMGGTLILRDVDLNLGISEERRYVFEIVGLDAAQFIAQMGLDNISATGIFDGTLPIVFDADGNGRIEEGILVSRDPGGNISYVGELTYEDLSAIANFAFDALRSLDYSQMRVVMNGPLTGEIVTQVRFDGVRQGEDAKTNFITKQLAKLPLQFRINIRAQFYQLINSVKAMYDPASVRDPRELGLLSDDGTRLLRRSITGEEAASEVDPEDIVPEAPAIQDQESE
ncbi:YdbH domain-containing protein [Qipengyuania sp. GH1]|uniref:YdbH domain-containing protein n=1 Tax=Qipengyuania aestuarii TaxID=2867241 RepID=UPI001C871478|nr:YdbH domain-containing protein [Qipengyuania aestuarii]MBX7534070.1 YdbH domain-containing protein [Qipengyuania aestuarii]